MEKKSITIGAINSWNKIEHQFSNLSFKHIAQPKLKVHFLKNALENINEEAKRGNFNSTNQIYYNFLNNLLIRSNINTG